VTQPAAAARAPAVPTGVHVRRWTRLSQASVGAVAAIVVALAFVPTTLSADLTIKLTALLILIMMATMWNALAGFGGLISIGQQAFIGLGAYGTVWFVRFHGASPYMGMLLATLACGVLAVPMSFFALRLRAAQFAIGMWVTAEILGLLVSFDSGLGAGTGTSLLEFDQYTPAERQHDTYWWGLAAAVLLLVALFVLLRSPLGASLQAIRDDDEAAASLGVRVVAGKRVLFVLAAVGCGAAGAMTLANTFFITTSSVFDVQLTAYMIFMVLVGGLGTFEGPILGAVVLWVIQTYFVANGPGYLIGLGLTAIVFALFFPRGVWGMASTRFGIQLLPVGYRVEQPAPAPAADGEP
jgi:branched-chain amino acid transport system permease protein